FQLAYTPPNYSTISKKVKGTVSTLSTLETSAAATPEVASISAARQALEELDAAGDRDKPANEIGMGTIQNAVTTLNAIPSATLGAIGKATIGALATFASHSHPDLKQKAEAWLRGRLPVFIYFEDYGRLKTRIHLPDFIAKQQNAPKDPEEQMLHRTQVALF